MRHLRRVYFNGTLSDVIELGEQESRKLRTVLRCEPGDTVEILTPDYLAEGEVALSGKRAVHVRILSKRDIIKPDYQLKVYQCITKREYMDFMIEKYSELGVTDIIPVVSSRSFDGLKQSSLERYVSISIESALQCEREVPAVIHKPVKIEQIRPTSDDNILFHERLGEKNMPDIKSRSVSMIIGPEGGFTDYEYNALTKAGFKPYTPINTILKAETAAVLFAGMVRLSING